MNLNISRWIWYCLIIAIFFMIISILYPGILFSYYLQIAIYRFCIFMVVNLIILSVLLGVLRKYKLIFSKEFLWYIGILLIGSIIINLLLFVFYELITGENSVNSTNFLSYTLISSVPNGIFNLILSKKIFTTGIVGASMFGIILGIINAYIGLPPLCY